MSWQVEEEWEKVGVLHARSAAALTPDDDGGVRRAIRVLNPTDHAVVLGSAQPEAHLDLTAVRSAGLHVVRRRSGGGAVLVDPGQVVWVDVVIPADDPNWDDDVGRAMWWLGEAWADALDGAGVPDATVWRGAMRRSRWSDRVCFAGVGSGEVSVGERKVVGISQRRTRHGALFQCAVPVVWDADRLVSMLVLPEEDERAARRDLAGTALGVGERVAAGVIPALLDRLA